MVIGAIIIVGGIALVAWYLLTSLLPQHLGAVIFFTVGGLLLSLAGWCIGFMAGAVQDTGSERSAGVTGNLFSVATGLLLGFLAAKQGLIGYAAGLGIGFFASVVLNLVLFVVMKAQK